MSDQKQNKLKTFEFIFEENSLTFLADSLRHAIMRLESRIQADGYDGDLLEIVLPDGRRLKYSRMYFVEHYYRRDMITLDALISKFLITTSRKRIRLLDAPNSIIEKANHIKEIERWAEHLPITFHHWFGKHYAMFIGDTNTRWFYDVANRELD